MCSRNKAIANNVLSANTPNPINDSRNLQRLTEQYKELNKNIKDISSKNTHLIQNTIEHNASTKVLKAKQLIQIRSEYTISITNEKEIAKTIFIHNEISNENNRKNVKYSAQKIYQISQIRE